MSWPANINVLRQLTSQSEMSALQRTKMYSIVTKGNSLPKPIESVNIYIKFQPFPRRKLSGGAFRSSYGSGSQVTNRGRTKKHVVIKFCIHQDMKFIDLRRQLAKMLEVNFNNLQFNACNNHDTPASLDLADWTTINVVEIRAGPHPPNLKAFQPSRLARNGTGFSKTVRGGKEVDRPSNIFNPLISSMIEKVLDEDDDEVSSPSNTASKENEENQKSTGISTEASFSTITVVKSLDVVNSRTANLDNMIGSTPTANGLNVVFAKSQNRYDRLDAVGGLRVAAETLVIEMVRSALTDISVQC